jgi:hypothetical protein
VHFEALDFPQSAPSDLSLRIAVKVDDRLAQIRQLSATPITTTPARLDKGLCEHAIELGGKEPGAAICHAELTPGCRDRTMTPYGLEQCNLARSEAAFSIKVDAKREASGHERS